MNNSRRRFIAGLIACTALATVAPSPAFAGATVLAFPTGNPVADMVAAANDNLGMTRRIGGRLAQAAGEAAAGGTLWRKLLGKSPFGRLMTIATIGTTAYEIYRLASGGFAPTGPVTGTTGPGVASEIPQDSTPWETSADFRPEGRLLSKVPVGGMIRIGFASQGEQTVYMHTWYSRGDANAPSFPISPIEMLVNGSWSVPNNISYVGSLQDPPLQRVVNGELFQLGFLGFPVRTDGYTAWRYRGDVGSLNGPTAVGNATDPEEVPGNANVSRKALAEVLNDYVAQALANDPSLAAEVGTPPVIKEADLEAILPKDSPIGKVSNSKNPMPRATHDPFTGQAPSTNATPKDGPGGTGTGSGGGSEPPSFSDPVPVVPIPDGPPPIEIPKPDEIAGRSGSNVCPSIGPNRVTTHCPPLLAARPFLSNMTMLGGGIATARLILKD